MASDSAPLLPVTEVEGVAPSMYLGALGMTGLTAWIGINDIGKPQEGETVVVSAAAGAVGSVAGQLAKAHGARAVGIAGGPEKCALLTEQLGFDAAVDYKAADWRDQLKAATPNGIDVDFENVGGDIMDAVFARLNFRARVALCGLISGYNDTEPPPGPRSFGNLLVNRVSLKGFIVLDHFDRAPEAIRRPGRPAGRRPPDAARDRRRGLRQAAHRHQHALRRREPRQARREGRRLLGGAGARPLGAGRHAGVHARGRSPTPDPVARVLADLARPRGEHLDHRSGPKPALQPPEPHAAVVRDHGPALPRAVAPTAAHADAHAGRPADSEQAHAHPRVRRAHAQAHDRERPEQLGRERRDHDRPVDRVGGPVAVDHAQADAVEARREGQGGVDETCCRRTRRRRRGPTRSARSDRPGPRRWTPPSRGSPSDGATRREAEVGDRRAVGHGERLLLRAGSDVHAKRDRVLRRPWGTSATPSAPRRRRRRRRRRGPSRGS